MKSNFYNVACKFRSVSVCLSVCPFIDLLQVINRRIYFPQDRCWEYIK